MISVVLAASISPAIELAGTTKNSSMVRGDFHLFTVNRLLTGVILLIGPTVFDQIELIVSQFPVYLETLQGLQKVWVSRLTDNGSEFVSQYFNTQAITGWVFRSSQQVIVRSYSITRGIIGAIFTLVFMLIYFRVYVGG
jgi:predicted PurR-regulated permease PerM